MIREAKISDSTYIETLLKSYSDNVQVNKKYIEEDMNNNYSKYYVYEIANIIVGIINIHIINDYIEILDIVVDENYRRKKIGTKLIEHIFKIKNNADITLEVRKSNTSAIELYQSLDFNIIQTRKNYYKNEDAYIMLKEIR